MSVLVYFLTPSHFRCLLLVLEQSRVEIAVLLNELAYLKYEASQDTSATAEAIFSKRHNVAVAYSLVEKIIKLISNVEENDGIFKETQSTQPLNSVFYFYFNEKCNKAENGSSAIIQST